MQTTDRWFRDIPQQFLGKENIEVLIRAFARQLQELQQVFDDLDTELDIDLATGQNLDYVGTIIPLSRKEAGELVNQRFHEPVISDERYRQYLRYKMLKNTSDCTYYDIMKAIEILWDVDRAYYYEREDRPATIFIGLPEVGTDDEDQARGKPRIMKPAGVALFYTARYGMTVDQSCLERVVLSHLYIQAHLHFFMRILNGEWFPDGSVILGQMPICDIAVGVALESIPVGQETLVRCPLLDIHAVAVPTALEDQCSIKAALVLDQSDIPDVDAADIGMRFQVCGEEKADAGFVTVRKDYWILDGQVLLDGSRLLDAEIREERL